MSISRCHIKPTGLGLEAVRTLNNFFTVPPGQASCQLLMLTDFLARMQGASIRQGHVHAEVEGILI